MSVLAHDKPEQKMLLLVNERGLQNMLVRKPRTSSEAQKSIRKIEFYERKSVGEITAAVEN